MRQEPEIRYAGVTEASLLTSLAMESKASWGYSAEFMEFCLEELCVTPEKITDRQQTVRLAYVDGRLAGFYSLAEISESETELDALFVDPEYMGKGIGSSLFKDAIAKASARGAVRVVIQSDPNAAEFYSKCGAKLIGEKPSRSIPGRKLPFFELNLDNIR